MKITNQLIDKQNETRQQQSGYNPDLYDLKEQAGLVYVGNGEWMGSSETWAKYEKLELEKELLTK